jgi:hypothetical protein
MLDEGANPNAGSSIHFSPLHNAITYRMFSLADLMIRKYGGDINKVDEYNESLLFVFVRDKNIDAIKFVVENKVDISYTYLGNTVYEIAKLCRENVRYVQLFNRVKIPIPDKIANAEWDKIIDILGDVFPSDIKELSLDEIRNKNLVVKNIERIVNDKYLLSMLKHGRMEKICPFLIDERLSTNTQECMFDLKVQDAWDQGRFCEFFDENLNQFDKSIKRYNCVIRCARFMFLGAIAMIGYGMFNKFWT